MRYVLGGIDRVRDGYASIVTRLVRVAVVGVVVAIGVLAATAFLFTKTPQSFLPEEDQGALFAAMRLPEGASINRTQSVVEQAESVIKAA
jgi:multidrug efflux pump subunit AcrB